MFEHKWIFEMGCVCVCMCERTRWINLSQRNVCVLRGFAKRRVRADQVMAVGCAGAPSDLPGYVVGHS